MQFITKIINYRFFLLKNTNKLAIIAVLNLFLLWVQVELRLQVAPPLAL